MRAVHALAAGAGVSLNERDPCRAALLSLVSGCDVTNHDAEFINDRLPADVQPTVALINPPFNRSEGRGQDRHAGTRHIRSALLRLAEGGRCVAVMSPTFAHGASGRHGNCFVPEITRPPLAIPVPGRP